jgi:hypothetical protein
MYDIGEAVRRTVTWYRATMGSAERETPLTVQGIGDYVGAARTKGVSWAVMGRGLLTDEEALH